MYVCVYVHVYVYAYVHTDIFQYLCSPLVYIKMHIYIYIHTYIYFHAFPRRSPELVKLCGDKGYQVIVADNLRLPYRTGSFDAAVSSIEHMSVCV